MSRKACWQKGAMIDIANGLEHGSSTVLDMPSLVNLLTYLRQGTAEGGGGGTAKPM